MRGSRAVSGHAITWPHAKGGGSQSAGSALGLYSPGPERHRTLPLCAEGYRVGRWFRSWSEDRRNIFGQFAEQLGHGIYEGIWVGPDSTIANTRGIRNDVVAALKALKVPN